MELEAETLRRMAQFFGGRACCCCGRPAERFAGHHFYCARHFPRKASGQDEPAPRVYRCHLDQAELAAVG